MSMNIVSLRKTEIVENESMSQAKSVFMRSQSVVSRRVAGETLIVPVRGKVGDLASIYSFNQTGSLIWQALESPKDLAELIGIVEHEYAVERDQAQRDVVQFLRDMLSADLVQVCEESCHEVSIGAMESMLRDLHAQGSQ
jgi:hypothetical protein